MTVRKEVYISKIRYLSWATSSTAERENWYMSVATITMAIVSRWTMGRNVSTYKAFPTPCCANGFRDDFTQEMLAQDEASRKAELVQKRKALSGAHKCMEELDKIIRRLYEDSVLGKLSDAWYMKLSAQYETEQAEIGRLAKTLEQQIESEA